MAQDTFVRDWKLDGEKNPDQMIRYLKEIQETYKTVTSFFVSDATKKYYHPTGIIKTLSLDDKIDNWYYSFKFKKELYEINLDYDTANPDSLTVFINYSVYDFDGNFIGVTGVGLSIDDIHNRVDRIQERFGRKVSFYDLEGNIMLSSDKSIIGSSIFKDANLKDLAPEILASSSGSFSYKNDGKIVYLNSRLIDEFQWYLIVEQTNESVEGAISSNLFRNLVISFIISIIVIFIVHYTFSRYQSRLEDLAITDKLTGVANRHVFDTIYDQVLKSAKRHKRMASFALLDLDHFKKINDTYGHNGGDEVLKAVSEILQQSVRDSDTVCRWGGEEFLIIFPECDEQSAFKLCQNICDKIAAHTVRHNDQDINITASIGVSIMQVDEKAIKVIQRIDQALYEAKAAGRNKVHLKHTKRV